MTRKTITLEDFEEKKDRNGRRYLRAKTDQGWMSCFKPEEIEKLRKHEKKRIQVEVTTSGNFTNIEQFIGEGDTQTEDEAEVQVQKISQDKPSTDRVDRAKALEIANGDIELAEKYFNYITKGN